MEVACRRLNGLKLNVCRRLRHISERHHSEMWMAGGPDWKREQHGDGRDSGPTQRRVSLGGFQSRQTGGRFGWPLLPHVSLGIRGS